MFRYGICGLHFFQLAEQLWGRLVTILAKALEYLPRNLGHASAYTWAAGVESCEENRQCDSIFCGMVGPAERVGEPRNSRSCKSLDGSKPLLQPARLTPFRAKLVVTVLSGDIRHGCREGLPLK